jgi:PAS domain S-box-containing protein
VAPNIRKRSPQKRPASGDSSDQHFRALIESLTDYAVFGVDLTGVISSWNPGVRAVMGYEADEFIGLPFAAIFTPEDVALGRAREEFERARDTGRSDDKRFHVRKDGSRFPADGVLTALRDTAGRVTVLFKVMHDTSAQQRTWAALHESEERYRLLLENIHDHAIFLLDEHGHVASWTLEAERMTGYQAEEILGQHFRVFFSPEDQRRGVPEQELRTAAVAGRAEGEGWRLRKDGSRFWGDEIVAPIHHDSGELRGFAKIVRDLTERQRALAEQEALYTQAREANRLKDEFLGVVSHELRTPLNAILGWAHLLEMKGLELDETQRRHAIRTIARNAQVQVQLVDDLLDVSRIISGRMRLQIQPTGLAEPLQAAVEAVKPAATAKLVEVRLHIDPPSAMIAADPDRLQQIVWNLLSNAIKFTSAGGQVHVRARHDGQTTMITVADTGIGIPADVVPIVFERFRQGDSSTTRRHGGVGLGLAIVRHLVELHGGSVRAASEGPGKGATFTVHLPAVSLTHGTTATLEERPPSPDAVEHLPSLANIRVVVVDDDPDTREVLKTVLSQVGALVVAADSASEALAQIAAAPPDVIIADIGMPDEDGYSFIQKVRHSSPKLGGAAPAIALTAFARREDRERALAAGYQRHLSKPLNPSTLVKAVADLLSVP